MNRIELKKALIQANVPQSYYNLDGIGETDQKMCLEHVSDGWVVYYTERGQRFDEIFFKNEEDACGELYKRLV